MKLLIVCWLCGLNQDDSEYEFGTHGSHLICYECHCESENEVRS